MKKKIAKTKASVGKAGGEIAKVAVGKLGPIKRKLLEMREDLIKTVHKQQVSDSPQDIGDAADQASQSIEKEILTNPEVGDVVEATGGVRKMRLIDSARGKGKRGGLRVLYLDLPDRERVHLIWFYDKSEADDLTSQGKKMIKALVDAIKGVRK